MPEFFVLYLVATIVLIVGFMWILYISGKSNKVDWGNRWLNYVDGFIRFYCSYYHGLKYNPVKLNQTGAAIIVANHISGLDPFLMIAACKRPLRFLIAREEYHRFGLRWLFKGAGCIPVDREKKPARAFREAIRALQSGEIVAIFPQGGIQIPGKRSKEIKAGAAHLAKLAQCPIVTMHISGIHRWAIGKVMTAIVVPSSARVHAHSPMDCVDLDMQTCLTELRSRISGLAQK